jgi:hypothetical protein
MVMVRPNHVYARVSDWFCRNCPPVTLLFV